MYSRFTQDEIMAARRKFPEELIAYNRQDNPSLQRSSATLQIGEVVVTRTQMLLGDTIEDDITVATVNLHGGRYSLLNKVRKFVSTTYRKDIT